MIQRQLYDDRADGINWEREDEQDTESTQVHTGADARTGGVCMCGHTSEQGQICANTAKSHMQVKAHTPALEQTQAPLSN